MFDFDGTLVDTAPDLIRAANIYLKAEGLQELPEAAIRAEIGMGLRRLILDLFPLEDRNEALVKRIEREFVAVYEREMLKTPELFPGAMEFLTEWDGQVAIVSNKRERFIHAILEKLGLHQHPWVRVIGGDTYPNMKPHPEPFLGAMAAAGTTPENSLMVGDGTPDVEGSLAVGCRCLAVEFGYQQIDQLMALGAHDRIESLHDLLPYIQRIT